MTRKRTGMVYRIAVRSELSDRYAAAFEGMETKDGETILTGKIIDQAHLYGILDRINGLGLELLSVQALLDEAHPSARRTREPELKRLRRASRYARYSQECVEGKFCELRQGWKVVALVVHWNFIGAS
jgi:hypothetical protein